MVITITLLALALAGITQMTQGGLSRSADTLLEVRGVALAQAYLDEIMSKRFDEQSQANGIPPCRAGAKPCTLAGSLGPDGETRATYDDVDDYHGLVEGDGEPNPLRDAQGATRTGYENFHISITVRYINVGGGGAEENLAVASELNDQYDAKLVSVSVSHRSLNEDLVFSAYKANY
jgi:MSHA pilin protein MshD